MAIRSIQTVMKELPKTFQCDPQMMLWTPEKRVTQKATLVTLQNLQEYEKVLSVSYSSCKNRVSLHGYLSPFP